MSEKHTLLGDIEKAMQAAEERHEIIAGPMPFAYREDFTGEKWRAVGINETSAFYLVEVPLHPKGEAA